MQRIILFLAAIGIAVPATAQETATASADLSAVNQLVKQSKYEQAEALLVLR